jgi:hypothetical protein
MKIIITEDQFNSATEENYITVYRGADMDKDYNSIWVSEDEEFASEYGLVRKYLMPADLNLIDVEYDYSTFEELVDLYGSGGDYEEYMYEPTPDFMNFLSDNGYDGLQNGLNILIFDKTKLRHIHI